MERGRFKFAGWVIGLVAVLVFMYIVHRPNANFQPPDEQQMTRLFRAVQNQTNKWTKSLEHMQFKPGQPIIDKTVDNLILIPDEDHLKSMSFLELEGLYMRYVENIQVVCGSMYHMGAEIDGGYHVCEKYLQKDSCLVYSFGCKRMFDFEDDIEKTYGCEIHVFDPFDMQDSHQHSKKVTFHKWGLGDKDEGRLLKLSSVKERLNHTESSLDILKIDIEGAEWVALDEIMLTGGFDKVQVFIAEFHVCLHKCKDFDYRSKEQYLKHLTFLRKLYDAGFRLYFFRQWSPEHFTDEKGKDRTGNHEVHFMRVY